MNPATGKRIVNELGDRKIRADAILMVGTPCVALVDKKGVENAGYGIDHCLRKGIVKAFGCLSDLAGFYNIPPRPLKATVERYNARIGNPFEEDFGKPLLEGAEAIHTPPFYAIRLWPKVHHTMGGVLINRHARVLDLSKRPIRRLYGAGEFTGGIHGACRLGCCAVTECLAFGRIAGRNAAAETVCD